MHFPLYAVVLISEQNAMYSVLLSNYEKNQTIKHQRPTFREKPTILKYKPMRSQIRAEWYQNSSTPAQLIILQCINENHFLPFKTSSVVPSRSCLHRPTSKSTTSGKGNHSNLLRVQLSSRSGARSWSAGTTDPSRLKVNSLPKMPGMAMASVATNKVAIMANAKIHWKAMVFVKNWPTPKEAAKIERANPMV